MESKKFDPQQKHKLNDPSRNEFQSPDVIWKTLNPENPEVIIDIGAGTGFFALPFADKIGQGRVYACDISGDMIQWMEDNIPERYTNRVIPLLSSENKVDLDNEIADLIFMINLHHELGDPEKMLRECRRLLKTGGRLIIIDWKVGETPFGPPLHLRIPAEVIEKQLLDNEFYEIISHTVLPYNSFVVGKK